MLDSGIAKMGLFAFVLLVSFAGLISLIPSNIIPSGTEDTFLYSNPSNKIPDKWYGKDLVGYNFTDYDNFTLTIEDYHEEPFPIGGRNLMLIWACSSIPYHRDLILEHRYGFGLLLGEAMIWYNEDNIKIGSTITYNDFNDDYEQFGKLQYEVVCYVSEYFKVTAILDFNATAYETPEEAWNNDDLDILVGINPEFANYQQDIWYVITNLLTFNTFYVFGTTDAFAVILNGIIACIVYGCIIIFVTAIILEVIPF